MLQYYINAPEAGPVELAISISDALGGGSQGAKRRPDRVFPVIVALSLAAHAALAAAFLIGTASDTTGGGAIELEAISVTIISVADPQLASSAGIATITIPIEPTQDSTTPTASADTSTVKAEASPLPPPESAVPPSDLNTVRPDTPPEIQAKAEPNEALITPDAKDDKRDQPTPPSQIAAAPSAPVSVGGNSVGQASASQGNINRYAREVALVIGRNRPKGIGAKGRVTVEFTLSTTDGSVQTSKVIKPSGSTKLDALALSLIDKSKYPQPPAGMTPAQLTYRVPFTFE